MNKYDATIDYFHNFADTQEPQTKTSSQLFNNQETNKAKTNHNNPQTHVIVHHNIEENGKELNDAIKPAISFQQQLFQNGGTLKVTNSHVTVNIKTITRCTRICAYI